MQMNLAMHTTLAEDLISFEKHSFIEVGVSSIRVSYLIYSRVLEGSPYAYMKIYK